MPIESLYARDEGKEQIAELAEDLVPITLVEDNLKKLLILEQHLMEN